jgi:hypothetical protein
MQDYIMHYARVGLKQWHQHGIKIPSVPWEWDRVSIFKVSTASNKDAILVELKKILTNAKAMAQIESMNLSKTLDFSLKPEVLIGKTLPLINLCIQNAQLKGQGICKEDLA